MLLQRMARVKCTPSLQLLTRSVVPRCQLQVSRSFAALPGPEDQWDLKKIAKGPIPPMVVLLGMALWMNRSKSPDGSPRMHNVSIKIFGANMPI
eukprot:Skav208162  [mRNA]  locus=scaffold3123:94936:102613:+ [translate_table: standard]